MKNESIEDENKRELLGIIRRGATYLIERMSSEDRENLIEAAELWLKENVDKYQKLDS